MREPNDGLGGEDVTGVGEYYYNVETHQVEEGRQSPWTALMGPYPTKEAAEHAMETAGQRSRSWDDDDSRWGGGTAQ